MESRAERRDPDSGNRSAFRWFFLPAEAALRVAGTGFLLAVFGLGSIVLAHGVLRIVNRGLPQSERELLAQARLQRWYQLYIRMGIAIGMFGLSTSNMERLNESQPALIVANHPTLLDVAFLLSHLPQGDCVVKREVWQNPALRGIVSAAGYIPNDGGEQFIQRCCERLKAGRTVVIFPEGTRSPVKGLGRFNRGAAHVALRSGCRILPVMITCNPPGLKKGQPWYSVPNSRLCYSLSAGTGFTAAQVAGSNLSPPIAARKITEYLRREFESGLGNGIA